MIRKIFDYLVIGIIVVFSATYTMNASFREAVMTEVRTLYSRSWSENIAKVPLEARRAVVGGCPPVLTVRLGDIDARFGVSRDDLIRAIQEATQAWNDASGGTLFAFQEDGVLPVSLVYDERQALATEIAAEAGTLKTQEEKLAFIQKKYATLKQRVDQKRLAYQALVKKYNKALANFENDVRRYESNPDTYDKEAYNDLQKERKKVQNIFDEVEAARKSVNSSVDELNSVANSARLLGQSFNQQMGEYNSSVTEKQSIQEDFAGVYFSDRRVEVYQFLNDDELHTVLIHELGHALGFEHNADPQSIMHASARQGQVLTETDRQQAQNLCR